MAYFSFPSAYSASSSSSSSSSPSSLSDSSSLSSIPSSMSPSPPATDVHEPIKSSSSSAAIPPLSPLTPADHPSRESYPPPPPQSLRLDASSSSSNSIHPSFHSPHPASAPPTQLTFFGVHDSDSTMGSDTNTNTTTTTTTNGSSHTPGLSQPYHSTHGPSFPSSSPALGGDLQSDSRAQLSFPSPHSAPHTRLHFRFDDVSKYGRFHLQQPPNSDTSLLEQRRMSEPSITNGYSFVNPQLRAAYSHNHNQHLPHMSYRTTTAHGSSAMPPPLSAIDTPRADDQHSSPFAWKMDSEAISSPLGSSFPVGSGTGGLDYSSSLSAADDPYGPSPPGTGNSSIGSTVPPAFSTFSRLQHRQSMPSMQSGQQQLGDESRQQYNFVPLPGSAVKKRPRRRYDEIERLYECSYPGCTKAYGTLNHLNAHVSMQRHGQKRSPSEFKELRKQWRKAKKEANSAQLENPPPLVYSPPASQGLASRIHHPSSGMHHAGVRPPSLGLSHNGVLLRRESEPDFQHHLPRLGGAPPLYVPQPPLHPRSLPGGGLHHEFGGPGSGGLLNQLPATGFPHHHHQQASSGLHLPPLPPSAGDYDAHESTFSYSMPGMGYPDDGHVHDDRPNTGHSYMSAASGDGGDGQPGTGHGAAGGHSLYLD